MPGRGGATPTFTHTNKVTGLGSTRALQRDSVHGVGSAVLGKQKITQQIYKAIVATSESLN